MCVSTRGPKNERRDGMSPIARVFEKKKRKEKARRNRKTKITKEKENKQERKKTVETREKIEICYQKKVVCS